MQRGGVDGFVREGLEEELSQVTLKKTADCKSLNLMHSSLHYKSYHGYKPVANHFRPFISTFQLVKPVGSEVKCLTIHEQKGRTS